MTRLLAEATIGIIVAVAAFWGALLWLPVEREPEAMAPAQRLEGGL